MLGDTRWRESEDPRGPAVHRKKVRVPIANVEIPIIR